MKKRIVLPAVLAAGSVLFLARRGVEAGVDAVSAASLTVTTSSITATSAHIDYSRDKYNYGTRTLYLNKAPAAPTTQIEVKTASGNSGSFTVNNLESNTQYNYKIEAIDTKDRERPYNTTGSFRTLAVTGIVTIAPGSVTGVAGAERFDAMGRRIGGGESIGKNAGGAGVIFTNRMPRPEYE